MDQVDEIKQIKDRIKRLERLMEAQFPSCPYCGNVLSPSKERRPDNVVDLWDCVKCDMYVGATPIGQITPIRIGDWTNND